MRAVGGFTHGDRRFASRRGTSLAPIPSQCRKTWSWSCTVDHGCGSHLFVRAWERGCMVEVKCKHHHLSDWKLARLIAFRKSRFGIPTAGWHLACATTEPPAYFVVFG